jgi:hypothetical protein
MAVRGGLSMIEPNFQRDGCYYHRARQYEFSYTFFSICDKSGNAADNARAPQAFKQQLGKLYFLANGTAPSGAVVVMVVVQVRKDKSFRKKGGKDQIYRQYNE